MPRMFLRFAGKLWENGEFEPEPGWETGRIVRRPRPDRDHQLELLDAAGAVVVRGVVELRADACRARGAEAVTATGVVGYLPLHDAGRTVVFRNDARVLYRVDLALEKPQIRVVEKRVEPCGRIHLRWEAEHERALTFDVVFIDGHRRAFRVCRRLTENHTVLDTGDLPGGQGCALIVVATDGQRSASVRTDGFDLPEKPPRLAILMPADQEILSPDRPSSLLGHAHGACGCSLPDDRLTWSVDDRVVARGQRLATLPTLAPGSHRIDLSYVRDNEKPVVASVTVTVAERSPEEQAWLQVSQSFASSPVSQTFSTNARASA
jgi:hypothetical protein